MSTGDVVIRVSGVSKTYPIYDRPLDRLLQALWRGQRARHREFLALSDVSFEVKRGEAVGIVGRNGSGKSTLLQLIAGTMRPTQGTIAVRGRLAALLELGSGFSPDFSGRENVFLNGAILGLSESEIARQFGAIAAFADIGEFIDQPVKTYSSGMVVRLAFAVSVFINPDILIIDEALSVGDELFQRKCFDRIHQLQKSGSTLLFVSHSAQSVVELCDRVILLDSGQCLMQGEPKRVVAAYHRLLYAPIGRRGMVRDELVNRHKLGPPSHLPIEAERKSLEVSSADDYDPMLISQSQVSYISTGALIDDVHLENELGARTNCLVRGKAYTLTYSVQFSAEAFAVRFGMLIKTVTGNELGGTSSATLGEGIECQAAASLVEVRFRFICRLAPGMYFANAGCDAIVNGERQFLHRITDAVAFRVKPEADLTVTGIIDFDIDVSWTERNLARS